METVTLTGRLYGKEVDVEVPVYGRCPLCGGWVYASSPKAYGCTNFHKNKCPLTIWKEYGGLLLPEEAVEDLLARGETDRLDGFVTRDGSRRYSARLRLEAGRVAFIRGESAPGKATAPEDE